MFPKAALGLFSLLFLTRVLAEEVVTPSSLLGPKDYNHHAFASKYLRALPSPGTTKQGPVLFPNDAPPPPRPPLIVTSRPLIESIARSELNPDAQNNTIPQSSQLSNVFKPFLARVKDYRPFTYAVATPATDYDYRPYEKNDNEDFEQQPPLPPIYKVFADHAKQKVAKIKQQRNKDRYEYQIKGPEYYHHRKTKEDINDNDEEGKNYAFSYRVKDKDTGDDFSHSQQSSGSATNGEYRVRLPDGRMQIVSYTADENGYQADVRYADDDKTNSIDHQNDDNYNYNHNRFNDNHNSIDNTHNNYNHNYNSIDNTHNSYLRNHNIDTGHNSYKNDFNSHNNYDNHDNFHVNNYKDYSQNKYNNEFEHKNDYTQRDFKTDDTDKYKSPLSTDYYTDLSKEYYNDDFSKEYESKSYDYAPHKSKFSSFVDNKNVALATAVPNVQFVSSTVKPSYEELKDLLVTKKAYNTVQPSYDSKIPVTISVPSTTPSTFEGTTERVVLIGGKKTNFYTNIRHVPLSSTPVTVTPSPVNYDNSDFSVSPTPMNYLVSTINSLRNSVNLSGPKPVLSNSYIDRINKYLRFN